MLIPPFSSSDVKKLRTIPCGCEETARDAIVAKAAINFASFVKEYFGKDIVADEGLFILPIGFSLPFRVEDFLSRKAKNYPTTPEANSFVNSIT